VIPRDYITEWRAEAPWVQDFQVEQDLVVSRALVEIFSNSVLQEALAFRGGTALYKLHLKPPARYSEDIDLVQTKAEPAGPMMDALRGVLDPWLGKPKWKQREGRVTFVYRFDSEDVPPIGLKLKVETNTREHFSVYRLKRVPFRVLSRWFEGACEIHSYELDELLGTKLRALYQRKAGRDLFDLAVALTAGTADPERIVNAFLRYMEHEGHKITRALFEENFALKMGDPAFLADISSLLSAGYKWDPEGEAPIVSSRLIERLPGDPWKGERRRGPFHDSRDA
jgi:predicted nucleotidyltransferase component of viral defense system